MSNIRDAKFNDVLKSGSIYTQTVSPEADIPFEFILGRAFCRAGHYFVDSGFRCSEGPTFPV